MTPLFKESYPLAKNMEPGNRQIYLRTLPAVDELLRDPQIQTHLRNFSKDLIVHCIRDVLEKKRRAILESGDEQQAAAVETHPVHILASVEEALAEATTPSLQPVINATGVVLHTNLGRAPLAQEALESIEAIARNYSNLEFDLTTGERGSRATHVEETLCRISGAESALIVNNNAGAVLLALNSLAEGREVIVSRGQLVEIGDSFRIPDVMKKSGAALVEVGTTNRTHLTDYEQAINERTALLLRVHPSNFRVLGFAAEVSLKELVALGQSKGLPVMEDLGSGCFVNLAEYGLTPEPTVQEAVEDGAAVVTFSGDKLLGGPQAGILVGKKKILDLLKKNPLNRALRIDKLTLAGLDSTLRFYLNQTQALSKIPVLRMLTLPVEVLDKRAKGLRHKLEKELAAFCRVRVKAETSPVGGGAMPLQTLPTRVLALRPLQLSAAALEERLRKGRPPVVARVKEGEILLDLRTVSAAEEKALLQRLREVLRPAEE